MEEATSAEQSEPRWPAVIAVLAAGGLYAALPAFLSVGPYWLVPAIVCALAGASVITYHRGHHAANILLGHLLTAVLTGFMLWSLVLLVRALPAHKEQPVPLLRSAALLWVTNVLVFALWYWRLDGGGPHARDRAPGHTTGSFLFPQMMLKHQTERGGTPWSPAFVDYLFIAFNTSTALSPTDAPVLSRWAKILMMIQASISLTVVVILAGRAVNIL